MLEYLNPVIFPIAHNDGSIGRNGDALQPLELRVAAPPAPESPQESPIGMEDLYAVVSRVCDADVALVVDGHAPWELELSFLAPFRAEGGQDAAVDVEDLDPVVVGVGHHDSVIKRVVNLATGEVRGCYRLVLLTAM